MGRGETLPRRLLAEPSERSPRVSLGVGRVLDTNSPEHGPAEKSENKSHLTGPGKREVGGLLLVYKYTSLPVREYSQQPEHWEPRKKHKLFDQGQS